MAETVLPTSSSSPSGKTYRWMKPRWCTAAHPRLQPELAADQLVLRRLRLVDGHALAFPDGARVGHRGAEEQGVEVVADVVVGGHGGCVALLRVPAAVQPDLLRRRGERLEI